MSVVVFFFSPVPSKLEDAEVESKESSKSLSSLIIVVMMICTTYVTNKLFKFLTGSGPSEF